MAKGAGTRLEEIPSERKDEMTFGPPRYYRLVCILWPWGLMGGPRGYTPVPESRKDEGPIIVEAAIAAGVPLHAIEEYMDEKENQCSSE